MELNTRGQPTDCFKRGATHTKIWAQTGFILNLCCSTVFMMVYFIYDTLFYGLFGYNISSYICWNLNGARDAQTQYFIDHQYKVKLYKCLKQASSWKKEFMMVYCIYDIVFLGFLGYNIPSYMYQKLSGASDAQTKHFTHHQCKVKL